MAAQNLCGNGVEGAQPGQTLDRFTDQIADSLLHFPRRLVGEGHRQDFPGPRMAGRQNMCQPRGQNPRLAGPRAGQHQHRSVNRLDRFALLGIEARHIAGFTPGRLRTGLLGNGK